MEGKVGNSREVRKGREGKGGEDEKGKVEREGGSVGGKEGRERGGRDRLGYLSMLRVSTYATGCKAFYI